MFQCAPLIGKVGKILTWRFKEPPKVEDELDHVTPHSPTKSKVRSLLLYFVPKTSI